MKEFTANVFGREFPVCSEDQKEKLEAAFKSADQFATEHENTPEGQLRHRCQCDMIIELLSPNPSRAAVIAAGIMLAKDIYTKKMAMDAIAGMMQDIQMNSIEPQGRKDN